jgi:hypothetical protein
MGKRWTDEDVDDLKRLAQRHPTPKIAEMIDRTVGSVVFKAHKLNVSLRTQQQEAQMSAGDASQPGSPN